MDCGNKALELIYEAVVSGSDLFLGHLDLIFKWLSLRLCEREIVPTLVRLLEVLASLLATCQALGYELLDFDAALLVPYVAEKCGNTKERVAAAFKGVMEKLPVVYPPKKYAAFLVRALKSKNARAQAGCLAELARVGSLHGAAAGDNCVEKSKAGSKAVLAMVDSKDATVRNAALDVLMVSKARMPTRRTTLPGSRTASRCKQLEVKMPRASFVNMCVCVCNFFLHSRSRFDRLTVPGHRYFTGC